MTASATLRKGGLYLSREVCERWFAGLESVVLLRRGDDLMILPVRHAAAGGYILKHRNSAGDRVVYAADFFRANGIDDTRDLELPLDWSDDMGGVVANSVFRL